ncbi:thiamine phosphate synthase [Chryseobacterium sp.]|uniref:thiamine phosphate synthase n=1 Tax=Chryseobacterium sp. TaxID=1871047 RepID=UPI0025BAD9EC|nr:thiamine phosphate synthase [Chryseobacterium sp.]
MIIVLTPERNFSGEADWINKLFGEGLDLLHIRKPFFKKEDLVNYLNKIDESFYSRIVLHAHYELGEQYGISRFHFREQDRLDKVHQLYIHNVLSTSVHDIYSYNTLNKEWEYAFLSPFFLSISKQGYGLDSKLSDTLEQKNNQQVKLIALGGLDEKTIVSIKDKNVDGVALLGAIWQNDNPLSAFKKIKRAFEN